MLDCFVVVTGSSLREFVDELLEGVLDDAKTVWLVAANKVEIFDEAGD